MRMSVVGDDGPAAPAGSNHGFSGRLLLSFLAPARYSESGARGRRSSFVPLSGTHTQARRPWAHIAILSPSALHESVVIIVLSIVVSVAPGVAGL